MQVLVYDDLPNIARSWVNKIQDAFDKAEITPVEQDTFQDLIEAISRRRTAWRQGNDEDIPIDPTNVDQADIVVVDYDLLRYSETADITGSRLAYLLRCFTRCGLIVVLNEYGTNRFDMSLRSPSQGFADLHLGADQIGNPGLWTSSFEGYRPWHWPVLPSARENFEKCVEDVQANRTQPILEFFGLERFVDWLPKPAHDFLIGSESLEAVQFDTFVREARGGIDSKDELHPDYMARVAAARLVSLLNGLILPEQGLLVDAPHLASRFPSLIQDEDQEIREWNRLCEPLSEEIDSLLVEGLADYRFEKQHWLWRPAWYWPDIAKDEKIPEVRDPWTVTDMDWVFCEDVSRFVSEEFSRDFRADVTPPFNKRYVLDRESARASEFASILGSGGARDPLEVEYVPQAAFSV